MRCSMKGGFLFYFKDNIKTYFVFVGMGNQHKGEKEGTWGEVLSRFGMERDPHTKERVGMLLSQRSEGR